MEKVAKFNEFLISKNTNLSPEENAYVDKKNNEQPKNMKLCMALNMKKLQ